MLHILHVAKIIQDDLNCSIINSFQKVINKIVLFSFFLLFVFLTVVYMYIAKLSISKLFAIFSMDVTMYH